MSVESEVDRLRRQGSDDLRARHAEPHRRYHTLEHVTEVQSEVARLLAHEPDADGATVDLAVWFHDAIYDVRAGGGASEDASARLGSVAIRTAGGAADLAEEVARLVRLTAGHEVDPSDRSGAVLVDADLWILSSAPQRYDRYARDVRAEYAHVPDDTWRQGRGAVLDHFLAAATTGTLYTAGPSADRQARASRAADNITRERQSL